jgi:hypothetical protein
MPAAGVLLHGPRDHHLEPAAAIGADAKRGTGRVLGAPAGVPI